MVDALRHRSLRTAVDSPASEPIRLGDLLPEVLRRHGIDAAQTPVAVFSVEPVPNRAFSHGNLTWPAVRNAPAWTPF